MKPVMARSPSRVGLKPATARTRCSRVKPIASPERNPLRIPSHPQSPNNGALFVFAIRPSQQIATPAPAESPVPTDVTSNRLTAPAHTETRPAPLDATDSRRAAPARKAPSLALRIVLKPPRRHRSKFSARTATFCFYEAILRDKTNFQRLDRRNEAASQRTDCLSQKSRKGRSPQRSPKKGADRHNRRQVPFVSMMCIRAVVRLALLHGAAHGCPLQPQISLCQPWERWVPIAAAGQRERRRAFDTLPAIHPPPPTPQ